LTEDECTHQKKVHHAGECVSDCPTGFVRQNQTCVACEGRTCWKKCKGQQIVNESELNELKGCQIIEGALEISIKKFNRKNLDEAVADIIEIEDFLKISRMAALTSLESFKTLMYIKGKRLDSNKFALIVWENQNLQELFGDRKVEIENGLGFFHFNPKLCFYKIEKLLPEMDRISNCDTAKLSNGDKAACNATLIDVNVDEVLVNAAIISWQPLKLEDERALITYVVFYKEAEGSDNEWMFEDTPAYDLDEPIIHLLLKLKAFTQYAYYVQGSALSIEKVVIASNIQYFTTLPGKPSKVRNLQAESTSNSEIASFSIKRLRKTINFSLFH